MSRSPKETDGLLSQSASPYALDALPSSSSPPRRPLRPADDSVDDGGEENRNGSGGAKSNHARRDNEQLLQAVSITVEDSEERNQNAADETHTPHEASVRVSQCVSAPAEAGLLVQPPLYASDAAHLLYDSSGAPRGHFQALIDVTLSSTTECCASYSNDIVPERQPRRFSPYEREKMQRYESIDTYEPETTVYKDHLEHRSKEPRGFIWAFVLILGVLSSATAIFLACCLHVLLATRYELLGYGLRGFSFQDPRRYELDYGVNHSANTDNSSYSGDPPWPTSFDAWGMLKGELVGLYGIADRDYGKGYLMFITFTIGTSLLANLLAFFIPESSGAGLPEIKAFLNGVSYRKLDGFAVLFVRIVVTLLNMASGAPMGHYGTLMVCGASYGSLLLARNRWVQCHYVSIISCFRNPRDTRNIIVIGAAAGTAAAFGVSIGGLMLIFELLSTAVTMRFAMYVFVACLISSVCMQTYFSYVEYFIFRKRDNVSSDGELLTEMHSLFGSTVAFPDLVKLNILDFIPAVALGIMCGLLTPLFIRATWLIVYFRRRLEDRLNAKWLRFVIPVFLTVVYVTIHFWIAVGFGSGGWDGETLVHENSTVSMMNEQFQSNALLLDDAALASMHTDAARSYASAFTSNNAVVSNERVKAYLAASASVSLALAGSSDNFSSSSSSSGGHNESSSSRGSGSGSGSSSSGSHSDGPSLLSITHGPCATIPRTILAGRNTSVIAYYGLNGFFCDGYRNFSSTKSSSHRHHRFFNDEADSDDSSHTPSEQAMHVIHGYASLAFGNADSTLQMLLSARTEHLISANVLIVFLVLYFVFAAAFSGLPLCGDTLLPSLIIGATVGRLVGLVVYNIATSVDPVTRTWADPSVFALIGAGSFLGGTSGLTFSVCVILMESTNNINHMLPLMVGITIAKNVAAQWSHDLQTTHLEAAAVPLLNFENQIHKFSMFDARHVMRREVVTLETTCAVRHILHVLTRCTHNGFPIVSVHDKTFKGIVLRHQLESVLWHIYYTGTPSLCTYEISTKIEDRLFHEGFKGTLPPFESSWMDDAVDLSPYIDQSAFCILHSATLPRMYNLFRTLGLRHLVVVSPANRVVGIITRKDLVADRLLENVIAVNDEREALLFRARDGSSSQSSEGQQRTEEEIRNASVNLRFSKEVDLLQNKSSALSQKQRAHLHKRNRGWVITTEHSGDDDDDDTNSQRNSGVRSSAAHGSDSPLRSSKASPLTAEPASGNGEARSGNADDGDLGSGDSPLASALPSRGSAIHPRKRPQVGLFQTMHPDLSSVASFLVAKRNRQKNRDASTESKKTAGQSDVKHSRASASLSGSPLAHEPMQASPVEKGSRPASRHTRTHKDRSTARDSSARSSTVVQGRRDSSTADIAGSSVQPATSFSVVSPPEHAESLAVEQAHYEVPRSSSSSSFASRAHRQSLLDSDEDIALSLSITSSALAALGGTQQQQQQQQQAGTHNNPLQGSSLTAERSAFLESPHVRESPLRGNGRGHSSTASASLTGGTGNGSVVRSGRSPILHASRNPRDSIGNDRNDGPSHTGGSM